MTEKNQTAVENKDLVVTFDKPYPFEGTDYKQIDLSNLENVTGAQLASVEQKVTALVPELSLDYALLLAAVVTGKPVEFFTQLPGRQAIKVKRTVSGFLNA